MKKTRKFKTRPVEVEAIQYLGTNVEDMAEWSGGNFRENDESDGPQSKKYPGKLYDPLHESWINVAVGDWVVRGIGGEYYLYSDGAFLWKYEAITDPDFSLTGTLEYRDGEVTAEGFVLTESQKEELEEKASE